MADFDKDLIISLSKLLEQTGLSEIEIENKDVGRIKVAKNLINPNVLSSSFVAKLSFALLVEEGKKFELIKFFATFILPTSLFSISISLRPVCSNNLDNEIIKSLSKSAIFTSL